MSDPLEKKVLRLAQIDAQGHEVAEFTVDGPTAFGRLPTSTPANWIYGDERDKPADFSQLTLYVPISLQGGGTDPKVSRIHCGIWPGEEGFMLRDLHSRNGTWVNDSRMSSPHALQDYDTIEIGDVKLHVRGKRLESENNYALLVGHEGGNLRGVAPDLMILDAALATRGFAKNITTLLNHSATKEQVLNAIANAAKKTSTNGHFIFYYSGHGSKEGLALGQEILTPLDLYRALGNVRGKKAVILDCCRAGAFYDATAEEGSGYESFLAQNHLLPPDTIFLGASSKDGKAYEGAQSGMGGDYMGDFTKILVEYLVTHRGHIDLMTFEQHLKREIKGYRFNIYRQKPIVAGDIEFSIMPMQSFMG